MLLLARERMGQHRVLSLAGKTWRLTCNGRAPNAGLGTWPEHRIPSGLYAPVVLTIEANNVGK